MGKIKEKVIKNQAIEGMVAEGKCIARHEGAVLFVKDAAPGDVVDLKITRKKKNYYEGYPIAFHRYSKVRTEPFCTHFGTCGGCKWQHINYDEQLKYKQQWVVDSLERIGKVTVHDYRNILPSKKTQFYRNKLEFTATHRRWLTNEEIATGKEADRNGLGFHIPGRFDLILDIDKCWLQTSISNTIRLFIRDYARKNNFSFYNLKEHDGLLRNVIIRTTSTEEIMVIVQFGQNQRQQIELLLDALKIQFPNITSLLYIINTKKNETYGDLEIKIAHGRDYILEEMEGLKFKIGPKSFYQTNSDQAYQLYRLAREFADLQGHEIVYDLYTGTGTIANFIAGLARKVVGVEYVPEAIKDAKENSTLNNITNTSFYAGDMKDILTPDFIRENGQPEVIITDPPRAGMHVEVIHVLNEIKAKKIVYISCNPATQARDLSLLSENYEVTISQPVDMFPHTHHVENVVLLELR